MIHLYARGKHHGGREPGSSPGETQDHPQESTRPSHIYCRTEEASVSWICIHIDRFGERLQGHCATLND